MNLSQNGPQKRWRRPAHGVEQHEQLRPLRALRAVEQQRVRHMQRRVRVAPHDQPAALRPATAAAGHHQLVAHDRAVHAPPHPAGAQGAGLQQGGGGAAEGRQEPQRVLPRAFPLRYFMTRTRSR
eukprot:COSAG01_NODE_458_length_16743_cov_124.609208_6_plen_125_part_00